MASNKLLGSTILLLLLLDRLTKYLALRLERDFFYFPTQINSRFVFGLNIPQWIIILLTVVILFLLILLIILFYKQKKYLYLWPLWFIIIGGMSNLADRVLYGGVIDFITIPHVSVFNLADLVIFCGLLQLIIKINQQPYDS